MRLGKLYVVFCLFFSLVGVCSLFIFFKDNGDNLVLNINHISEVVEQMIEYASESRE